MRITETSRAQGATAIVSFDSFGSMWVTWTIDHTNAPWPARPPRGLSGQANRTVRSSNWHGTPPTLPDLAEFALRSIYAEAGMREQLRLSDHSRSRSSWPGGRWQEFHRLTFTPGVTQ